MPERKDDRPFLPVLPLRDVVVYPNMVLPLFVGRPRSISALELAMSQGKEVFLVAQTKPQEDSPTEKDIFQIGTAANILQLLRLPDGTVKVLVEGQYRAEISELVQDNDYLAAHLKILNETPCHKPDLLAEKRSLVSVFEQYVKLNRKIPPEILTTLNSIDELGRLADTIAAHLTLKLDDKQKILEEIDVSSRVSMVMGMIETEIDLLQVEKRVRGRVKRQMEKSQREYYLNEQMKAIQKELGDLDDVGNESQDIQEKIEKSGMSKEAKQKAYSELNKLRMMPPMSSEATVVRTYIDWLLAVPWKKRSKIRNDLTIAETVLDKEHYGLEKVKERILEYLAVQQRVRKLKGPILCLVGPPGVGKTSLGQSIANATNREFLRIALGGVRDEAEIRGHRRTYIGAMPGKIVQKLAKSNVVNPLLLLDEIDKMSSDFRGDPASAMLEVLDPEQNHTFSDHYLEVDYDLSEVMFVATANSYAGIPRPLLDRMEIIFLSGYTEDEKVNIAENYLLPKQIANNGLKEGELVVTESAIYDIVRYYTREAGVRNLERELAKVCRKVVKSVLLKPNKKSIKVTEKNLETYLGVRRFRFGQAEDDNRIGQVTGLAWTEVGGELLSIETAAVAGKGKTLCTGRLGNVMQESINAALTVVRSRAKLLGIAADFNEKMDVHVHVPEGATPKDGPSAGIGMCTGIVSALTQIPVRADLAMTGEITLRGEVLPIGGLKEKLLAARRGGIKHVIIPQENEKDLKDIPAKITSGLEIHLVKWIDEVLTLALVEQPVPLDDLEVPKDEVKKGRAKRSGKTIRPH